MNVWNVEERESVEMFKNTNEWKITRAVEARRTRDSGCVHSRHNNLHIYVDHGKTNKQNREKRETGWGGAACKLVM